MHRLSITDQLEMVRFVGRRDWEILDQDTPSEHLQLCRNFQALKIYIQPDLELQHGTGNPETELLAVVA